MLLSIQIENEPYRIDTGDFIDLSIPLNFSGPQPNVFGAARAVSHAVEGGTLVGDTRRGGSCNFEQYTFIPHCNGTHTESIGHITHERISVRECLRDVLIPALLVTVAPVSAPVGAAAGGESYSCAFAVGDRLITKKSLSEAAKKLPVRTGNAGFALIVRTLPNDESKLTRDYSQNPPPFFSNEAMELIVELGVEHLLTDLPSIDRMNDEGKLANHRIFWNLAPEGFALGKDSRIHRTITEMIYVPEIAVDGAYLLNLQIPAFAADAAPSRPLIFKLEHRPKN